MERIQRIATKNLKECRQDMAESFYNIIDCSLKTEKVPKEQKIADTMSNYKYGNKEEPLNYRPVTEYQATDFIK